MKAVFVASLIAAVLSLVAVFGFAAATVVPQPGAESSRAIAMTIAGVFFVVWIGLAFWARTRQKAEASAPVPGWLKGTLLVVSVLYSLAVVLGVLG